MQDCFAKLWTHQPQFPSERAAYSWLYRTANNAGIDYLRSGRYRYEQQSTHGSDGELPFEDVRVGDSSRLLESRQELARVLKKMSDREARVLIYRELDGMTGDEIAEVMDISRKTVVRTWAQGEAKLRELRHGLTLVQGGALG